MSFLFCPACDGHGERRISGSSVDPLTGVTGYDPQEDRCETCDRCHGTGVRPTPYRDCLSFDVLSDERAEAGEPTPYPEPARLDESRSGVRIQAIAAAPTHPPETSSGLSSCPSPEASAESSNYPEAA